MGEVAVHEFKTWRRYFVAVADGRKTFEVRDLSDRQLVVAPGDHLLLREWDGEAYTGRALYALVTYMCDLEPAAERPLIGMSIERLGRVH